MVNYDPVHQYGAEGGALSYGGGLWGTQSVVNCTFANNTQNSTAAGEGGAIYAYGASTPTLMTCCTFIGNTDQTGKAAVLVADGTAGTASVVLQDSIFARNNNGSGAQVNYFQDNLTSSHTLITSTDGNVCDATVGNNGQNIIGVLQSSDSFANSALAGSLGALANNGGQVQTIGLNPGSVAIGRGVASATVPVTDARGATRRTPPDAGAFETLPALSIATTTLANGTQDVAGYSQAVTAAGGDGGYTYAVTTGSLPAGLTMASATGVISGTPTGAGSSFTITVTDAIGFTVFIRRGRITDRFCYAEKTRESKQGQIIVRTIAKGFMCFPRTAILSDAFGVTATCDQFCMGGNLSAPSRKIRFPLPTIGGSKVQYANFPFGEISPR